MVNLKELRERIAFIKSTRQITSAMKMVSASKMRKGQNTILNLRPYEENLKQILDNINKGFEQGERNNLCIPKPVTEVLVVILGTNKGLSGNFNSYLNKSAVNHIRELSEKGFKVKLWIAGKKVEDFFKKSTFPILQTFHPIIDNVTVNDAFTMARKAMELINNGMFQKIDVVYNRFKNATVYEIRKEQFLPMIIENAAVKDTENELHGYFGYILEPSRMEIMDEIVPKFIETYMYRILLDSFVSEQGARMTAMHTATENATELLKNLTITYNKIRQASITNEIVEFVSGAEALNARWR